MTANLDASTLCRRSFAAPVYLLSWAPFGFGAYFARHPHLGTTTTKEYLTEASP